MQTHHLRSRVHLLVRHVSQYARVAELLFLAGAGHSAYILRLFLPKKSMRIVGTFGVLKMLHFNFTLAT